MKQIDNFLRKVDAAFPNPWIVEGVEQVRPVKQLGFIIGVIVTAIFLLLIN